MCLGMSALDSVVLFWFCFVKERGKSGNKLGK